MEFTHDLRNGEKGDYNNGNFKTNLRFNNNNKRQG